MNDDDFDGSKAECWLMPTWAFRLGKRDALLVLKALGGRLTSAADIADAKALGDRLTALRANAARDLIDGAERAESSMLKRQAS